jgi:hypothetical protein
VNSSSVTAWSIRSAPVSHVVKIRFSPGMG